jgi:hypothetical protein
VQRLADGDAEPEQGDRNGQPEGPADEDGSTTAPPPLPSVELHGHGT